MNMESIFLEKFIKISDTFFEGCKICQAVINTCFECEVLSDIILFQVRCIDLPFVLAARSIVCSSMAGFH